MPTYEYRREDGSIFEYRQGINDEKLTRCPDTGQKVVRIISGGGGVVYKGDGWYVTDYKKKDDRTPEQTRNEPGTSSDNGTATSSPSTPAKDGDI